MIKRKLFHVFSISWMLCSLFFAAFIVHHQAFVKVNSLLCLVYSMWYFLFIIIPLINGKAIRY